MKTINVPDWCEIGKFIEFKMYDPDSGKSEWFRDKIISYSDTGFFHQAHNCPVYHNKFSDYGKTVREINEEDDAYLDVIHSDKFIKLIDRAFEPTVKEK